MMRASWSADESIQLDPAYLVSSAQDCAVGMLGHTLEVDASDLASGSSVESVYNSNGCHFTWGRPLL